LVKPKVVGVGFTVTVIVNGIPIQVPEVGVMVYSKVAGAVVVLVRVWLIKLTPVDWAEPPVTAPIGLLIGVVHV
jgi:hypothetical protein